MRDIQVSDPAQRALLLRTLMQDGLDPARPEDDEPCLVTMSGGPPLTGEPAYLVASLRYLLFQALTELDNRKVGFQ